MKWQKNQTQKNSEQIPATISRKNGIQQRAAKYIISNQTPRARQVKLVDENINALKLPRILPHINIIGYLW